MILDRDDVSKEIADLGLAPNIVKLTMGLGAEVHQILETECYLPLILFEADVTPFGRKVTPLWERSGVVFAFWDIENRTEFIKFDVQVPDDYQLLGYSVYSVIADILIWLRTDIGESAEDLVEVGRLLEFPSPKDFMAEIEEAYKTAGSYSNFKSWRDNRCLSVGI